jgi:hypothetical protein
VIYPHENMPLDKLCDLLHRQGAIWFSNPNLLLLEELIRRAKKTGATPGDTDGQRNQPVRDVRDRRSTTETGDACSFSEAEIATLQERAQRHYKELIGEAHATRSP